MRNPYVSATLLGFEPQPLAVTPTLGVTVELEFNEDAHGAPIGRDSPEQEGLKLIVFGLEAALHYGRMDQNISKGFLSLGTVVPPFGVREVSETDHMGQVTVIFPLTNQLVRRIEDLRAGTDAQFRVGIRLSGLLTHPNWQNVLVPIVLDRLEVQRTKRDTSPTLTVSKSDWAERMLPSLQYGKWQIYELPLGEAESATDADHYIAEAFAQFSIGNYKRAISASRDAVEAMRERIAKSVSPTFGDARFTAEEKGRRATDAWSQLIQGMLEFEGALTSLMAVGAHPRPAELTVTRYDAELALSFAASWRRYLGARLTDTKGAQVAL